MSDPRTVKQSFMGIDPGNTGAVAIINQQGEILLLQDYPGDEFLLAGLLNSFKGLNCQAAIELVVSFGMGRKGAFTFGGNFHMWRLGLAMLKIPFRLVRPQIWQKGIIGAKAKKTQGKQAGLAVARRMFPKAELHLKKHHGRADALLIADWLRRQYVGK